MDGWIQPGTTTGLVALLLSHPAVRRDVSFDAIPDAHKAVCTLLRISEQKQNRPKWTVLFLLVAGPGIAPGPGGYEPPEILLLHPAIGR